MKKRTTPLVREGCCSVCQAIWPMRAFLEADQHCPVCGFPYLGADIATWDIKRQKPLTPCTRARAEEEIKAGRAEWQGDDILAVRVSPLWRGRMREDRIKGAVLTRDHHICQWCGEEGRTVDHLIPRSQNGPTTPENLVCACIDCNGERDALPAEAYAALCGVQVPVPGSPRPKGFKKAGLYLLAQTAKLPPSV